MPEKIATIYVGVQTVDDDKEDSQFELNVKQGVVNILEMKEGAGISWDDGDFREFSYDLDVDMTNENIEVVGALQDGPWGRSNHWNAHVEVIIRTNQGRQLTFERDCAFRTGSRRRRHEISFGTKRFGSHSVRYQ